MLSLDARARLYVFPHPRITCGIHYVRYVVEFAGGSRVCASPWVFAIIQGDGKSTSTVDELHGGPSKSFLADRCARLLRIRLKGPDEPSNSGNFRGGESDRSENLAMDGRSCDADKTSNCPAEEGPRVCCAFG